MKRKVADEIKKLSVGDLVGVCWGDASVGKKSRMRHKRRHPSSELRLERDLEVRKKED